MSDGYDIFVSYAHRDTDAVRPIADAIASGGLRVWFDAVIDFDFSSITRAIRDGLSKSKALLAYYSHTYPTRRPCQWELTAAFLAAQRDGDPRRRIYVLNPEDSTDHLQPIELRDALFVQPPAADDLKGLADLAHRLLEKVAVLKGDFGEIQPVTPPIWHGSSARGSPRFVGRLRELWAIHSALHGGEAAITTAAKDMSYAQVRGLGGNGKSLLVEEYALRFGAAHPGGVFWSRASGQGEGKADIDPVERDAERHRQWRSFAVELGASGEDLEPENLRGTLQRALARAGKPCLWVVDDLPGGLSKQEQDEWLAPHPLAKTLITTRSREYDFGGGCVELDVLPETEAFELLTSRRQPQGTIEVHAARSLVHDLGRHALAVDVTGGALAALIGIHTFQSYRAALSQSANDALLLAKDLGPQLPNGHEKSIAKTFLSSIETVGKHERDVLRLASLVAASPIPPRVIQAVIQDMDQLDEPGAIERTARSLDELARRSLLDPGEAGFMVHTLVSRTVRFTDSKSAQMSRLWSASARALGRMLTTSDRPDRGMGRNVWQEVAPYFPHVFALTYSIELYPDVAAECVPMLSEAASLLAEYGQPADATPLVEHALRLISPESMPRDYAILTHQLATAYQQSGDFEKALDLFQSALRILRGSGIADNQTSARILTDTSVALKELGRLDEARELAESSLRIAEAAPGNNGLQRIDFLNNYGMILRAGKRYDEALEVYGRALSLAQSILPDDHPRLAVLHNNLGLVHFELGQLREAWAHYEDAFQLSEARFGSDHPGVVSSLKGLGDVLRKLGRFDEALGAFERGLRILEASGTQNRSQFAALLQALGSTRRELGDPAGALPFLLKVLTIDQESLGPTHVVVAAGLNEIGLVLQDLGRWTEARDYFERALAIRRARQGNNHVDLVPVLFNLSTALWNEKALAEAHAALIEALHILEASPDAEADQLARVLANLGPVLRALGRLPEARSTAERALELDSARYPANHPTIANDLITLGRILFDQGQRAEARANIERAITILCGALGEEHFKTKQAKSLLGLFETEPQRRE